ncbi:MAG: aspartate-semialdehyde dehydrogenase [Spirochaetales bacterium]|jgi:aspartate-semialdehyde dehydrogenase|nr:aspartate-semialdehyde dehydrogenase [Exilispira sp.]NMC66941.1 aspartate-semialdehyde dehydrogenase [Spirochaetales bacterium]
MNIGIIGATGLVGKKMIELLESSNIKIDNIYFFASEKSKGNEIFFRLNKFYVEQLTDENILNKDLSVVFIASGNDISEKYSPILAKRNVYVIDKSSRFRMDENVPLVVPEVNFDAIKETDRIIANPNCSTIPLAMALANIDKEFHINKIFVASYQSVSGAGKDAVNDYDNQLKDISEGKSPISSYFKFPIVGNLIPQIDDFYISEGLYGYTKEEGKLINELQKILRRTDLFIDTINVRVPVKVGHSEAVFVETDLECSVDEIKKSMSKMENLVILDDFENSLYPMPYYLEDTDSTYVGRIKQNPKNKKSFSFWLVADNLRRGAAFNAYKIFEKLIEMGKIS